MKKIYLRAGVAAILLGFLLVGMVAGDPPTITLTASKVWLVANGTDSGVVTVTVFNGTIPMNGSTVVFSVDDPVYGSFSVSPVYTSNGVATSSFTTKYKSGTAQINADVTYQLNGSSPVVIESRQIPQKIDHDIPFYISAYHLQSESTVATIVPITIWLQDAHNNPIDNRREPVRRQGLRSCQFHHHRDARHECGIFE